MPSYNLGEIMSQATWRAGRRADLEASYVSFLANEAYMEVAQVYPRALSEQTAQLSCESGTAFIELPADCEELVQLKYADSSQSFALIGIDELDSYDTGPGQPYAFAFYANGIEVWPSPNSSWSLSLRYRAAISDMTELSSVPSLATPWRPAIVLKLEEKIHAALANVQGAAVAQQRYLGYVSQLKNDEARRQSTGHPRGVRLLYGESDRRRMYGDDWWETH